MLLDANLLIYAHDASSPFHEGARSWVEEQLNGPRRVAIPWPTVLAYLRLTTNPRVTGRPLSPDQAWRHVEGWFTSPMVWAPVPTEGHGLLLGRLVTGLQLGANLIPDAHLADLAMEHGLESLPAPCLGFGQAPQPLHTAPRDGRRVSAWRTASGGPSNGWLTRRSPPRPTQAERHSQGRRGLETGD